MAKILKCADVTGSCPHVVRGSTEDEILRLTAEHASAAHGMRSVPVEVAQKIKESIRDE